MSSNGTEDETRSVGSDYSYIENGSQNTSREEFNDEGEKHIREIPEKIVPYLARRAYYIPGNNWFQDWFQYVMANNHPFFGLFCHYKFHPVTLFERVMVFLMSVGASLIVSNTFLLYFLWKDGRDTNAIELIGGDDFVPEISYESFEIASLTLGAVIVTIFDFSIWYIAACGCCEAGGKLESLKKATVLGTALLFLMLLGIILLTVLLLLLAGTYLLDDSLDTADIFDAGFGAINVTVAISDFGTNVATNKWTTWLKQLFLSMFVYDFIISTVFFTGIFGCLPLIGTFLGGRPAEVKESEKKARKAARKKKRKAKRELRKSSKSRQSTASNSSESS